MSHNLLWGVKHNPQRPPIQDFDGLPSPTTSSRWTGTQPAAHHCAQSPQLSILTSRGCPYQCSTVARRGHARRARSASVVAEWRWLVQDLGAKEIGVLDDSST